MRETCIPSEGVEVRPAVERLIYVLWLGLEERHM